MTLKRFCFALLLSLFALLPTLAAAQSKMFWSERLGAPPNGTIYSANLDGSSPMNLFPLNDLGPVHGLAVDQTNKKIYWSDSTGHRIRRANFDGSGVETVIGSLVATPASLGLDPASQKVYWISESPANHILRANFDGTGLETLYTPDFGKRSLALDVAGGKMYWPEPDRIRRANLDGSSPEDLVFYFPTDPPVYPGQLALDLSAGKLYWAEIFGFDIPNASSIRRADLDGTAQEDVLTGLDAPSALALDVAAAKVYWVHGADFFRANFDGTSVETVTPAGSIAPGFIALYIAATSTFAGMPNTSLGQANLSLDLSNHLVISNLGSSGLDGVRFSLGQARFGELDFGGTLALSPGALVQASAIGSLNNVPGQTIGSIRFTGVSGGKTNVQFDLSPVGQTGPCVIVYNGATQVFLGVVPGNSVEVAGITAPCFIPFQPVGANAQATVFLRQKLPISTPGGPTVTGDRIVALAENITSSVEYVSDISVTGANLSSFTLEAEALGLFGTNLHEAAGNAHLTSTQQPTSLLTVSNLGASLLDGVDIDLEEAGTTGPCMLVGLQDLPLSGVNEQVHFAATGPVSGTPTTFGQVNLLATGTGFNVNVDYSAIGSSMVEVMVFNAGVPVGSAIVPAGTVGTISGPATLTRTFVEAAGIVGPCVLVGFRNPVGFAFASTANSSPNPLLLRREGGFSSLHETSGVSGNEEDSSPSLLKRAGQEVSSSVLLGDEIHFHAVNSTSIPSGIAEVALKMANVPQFTIIDEESDEPPTARVFLASGAISIDRSKPSASKGDIHSKATITFKKGDPTTFTGNLSAVGKITIDKDNTIVGNATSGSSISVASGSTITGARQPNEDVASLPVTVASFTAGGANITVAKNGVRNLNPGSYGTVTVGNSAKLNMKSGEYRFVKLETQNHAFLNFDVSNGSVQVKVTSSLKIDDEVVVTITPGGEINSNSVDFITLQSSKVSLDKESYVLGTLIAPNAEVFLDKAVSFRGAIMAKKITVDRDVTFVHHTSLGVLPLPKAVAEEEATDALRITDYALEQNYPNPFNPSTTISFALPQAGEVSLKIFNLNGQLVKEVASGRYESGRYAIVWDGKDAVGRQVASGVYFYVLKTSEFTARKKLLLMK